MKSFAIKINEKKNNTEILLSGNLTVSNSESIYQKILGTVTTSKKISIHLNNIENIDLTLVQILYSVKRTILKEGKELTTTANLPKDLSLLLDRNGFKNLLSKS
ncbi:MAG: STAS domain-containing protein [Sporocytophaga sp.]|nr:STAS domain-containing protein [Sporocytophaga sp.]